LLVARQEAILAAISEKDAHIAVLEMAPNKKTENIEEVEKLTKEKLRLQQVLKDLVSEQNAECAGQFLTLPYLRGGQALTPAQR